MAFCGSESHHPNEMQLEVQQYNPIPAYQPGHQNNAVIETGQGIQHEGEMSSAQVMNNGYVPVIGESDGDYNDCFRVVRSSKHVEIPCTRNEYQRYKVKVPKQVNEQVPRRVQYTDYETRERKEPYSVKRFETAYHEEDQPYTIQVPKKVTRMVKVVKKVPRTVYVDVTTEEPREQTIMVSETRSRRVKVPYQKEVIDQQYRTVKESVPVTKFRTEYDTIIKTVYEDSWRTKVVPVTKVVHKDIPVFEVVPNEDCTNCVQVDAQPVQVLPESNYNDHMKPYVETYQPYVETHTQPALAHQGVQQYEPQPVMYDPGMPDTNPTTVIQHAPVPDNAEPVQVMQSSEPAPLANASENQHEQKFEKSDEAAPLANALESQDEQKFENSVETAPQDEQKFVKTKYSVPAKYDANEDGKIDAQEFENAQKDGNVHVDRISVVQKQQEDEAVVGEVFSQAPRRSRTRRKKSGGRRRRKSRR